MIPYLYFREKKFLYIHEVHNQNIQFQVMLRSDDSINEDQMLVNND